MAQSSGLPVKPTSNDMARSASSIAAAQDWANDRFSDATILGGRKNAPHDNNSRQLSNRAYAGQGPLNLPRSSSNGSGKRRNRQPGKPSHRKPGHREHSMGRMPELKSRIQPSNGKRTPDQ